MVDAATGTLKTEANSGGPRSRASSSDAIIADDGRHRTGFPWDGAVRSLYADDVALARSNRGVNVGCGKLMAPSTFFTGLIDDLRICRGHSR